MGELKTLNTYRVETRGSDLTAVGLTRISHAPLENQAVFCYNSLRIKELEGTERTA